LEKRGEAGMITATIITIVAIVVNIMIAPALLYIIGDGL
jgi:hypothetical protein